MAKITKSDLEIADLAAAHSRQRDIELFARLSLEGHTEGLDTSALLKRIDQMAPGDGELAWSVVRNYWRLCNERTAHYRTYCEGSGSLLLFLPMVHRAYFSLALLSLRALTGLRVVSLRRMQPILRYLYC